MVTSTSVSVQTLAFSRILSQSMQMRNTHGSQRTSSANTMQGTDVFKNTDKDLYKTAKIEAVVVVI